MPPKDQHKIIIFEADLDRRDYLRSIISELGYIPFCFEKETACLDKLTLLNPDLVISGPLPLERVSRFIYTLKMINPRLLFSYIAKRTCLKNTLFIIRTINLIS